MTIKEIRTSTGLSQKKFAEKYNIPRRTIEDWETNKRIPPVYVTDMIEWRINTDMRERTYARLMEYAIRLNAKMSSIVDEAVTEYLDKEEKK